MLDLLPVFFEGPFFVEVGAIVDVVALETLFLRVGKCQSHRGSEFFELLFIACSILFGLDMLQSWSMAILTAIAMQIDRAFQSFVSGFVGRELLRIPTGNMAGDALGVKVPCHRSLGRLYNRIGRMSMGCLGPNLVGCRMALTTLGCPGETAS